MNPTLIPFEICAKMPPGAEAAMADINGYVLWVVLAIFGTAALVGIGAIVTGRLLGMPHVTKGGVVTLIVVAVAAVLLPVYLPILQGLLGSTGCIG